MDPVDVKHAIAMVRQLVNRYVERGFLKAKPAYVKAWYKYGLRFSSKTDLYPTMRAQHVEELCAEARSNPDVFDLVKFFTAKRLHAGGQVPPAMSNLIGDYLLNTFTPTSPGSGRRRNWGRDIVILIAIKEVLRTYDVSATHRRNLSTDPNRIQKTGMSASEIVQAALRATDIGAIDVHRIHRIWEKRKNSDELQIYLGLRVESEFDDELEVERI